MNEAAEGWTFWAGGECPIPADTTFKVTLRNGKMANGEPNQTWRWSHTGHDGDIVAYRIVPVSSEPRGDV